MRKNDINFLEMAHSRNLTELLLAFLEQLFYN